MTLFRFEPTEILSRPERKIIWAEVQIRGPNGGVVRKIVESPDAAGPEGICAEILALCYQHYPSMARPDVLAALRAPKPEPADVARLRAREMGFFVPDEQTCSVVAPSLAMTMRSEPNELAGIPSVVTGEALLNVLRAKAEAAGVRVDGRWGEARLREEIAAVRRREAAQDA